MCRDFLTGAAVKHTIHSSFFMATFVRVTRCKRCKTAFHDLMGRCPECNLMTRKGRKARVMTVTFILLSVAVAVLALYLLVQNALQSGLPY